MENTFEKIADQGALENWITRSYREPVVIFKHSNSCGISARAHAEMSRVDLPIGLVTVQDERDVSDEIETRFNLAHETPQALVLRNSEIVWSGSHGQITSNALVAAVEKANTIKQKVQTGAE